jgi:hypothetical protein
MKGFKRKLSNQAIIAKPNSKWKLRQSFGSPIVSNHERSLVVDCREGNEIRKRQFKKRESLSSFIHQISSQPH